MNKTRPPTMKDVAARAGVACSTVSMALRNDPSIPKATQDRIRELADGMGYRANPLVSALMSNLRASRQTTSQPPIALLHSHPRPSIRRSDPYFKELVSGTETRAMELGYQIQEFWLEGENTSDARTSQILNARGIRGVIVAPVYIAGRTVNLDWSLFAGVVIGYSMNLDLHRSCSHQFHGITVAMTELKRRGYKRIGLVLGSKIDRRSDHNYQAGYLLGQSDFPARSRLPIFWVDNQKRVSFKDWFQKYQPDVIVTAHQEFLENLHQMHVSIPGDIGFVHLDLSNSRSDISGISQKRDRLGRVAVDLVVEMLQRNERGLPAYTKTVMIEGEWVEGATVSYPDARIRPTSS